MRVNTKTAMAGRKRGKMLAFLIGWESATIYFFQPIATQ